MSPRNRAQAIHAAGISWWLAGPALALWLVAVIALSAAAGPTGNDSSGRQPASSTTAQAVEPTSGEAPILTLVVAAVPVVALAARPARRAVARRRIR